MSEAKTSTLQLTFNQSVKVQSSDIRITSDAGALILREADHRLGLIESIGTQLFDPRNENSIRYTLVELLRERIFCSVLGYTACDDCDRLAHDPALKIATWDRPGAGVQDERLASQPTQSRLTDILSLYKGNLETLRLALSDWVFRHLRGAGSDHAVMKATLDIDSFPIQAYGKQEGASFNGYYEEKIYNPIIAGFSPYGNYDHKRLGDGFVHGVLRAGNADSAQGALRFIRQAIRHCSSMARSIDVRFDAAFVRGSILDPLTEDGVKFVGRIKKNAILKGLASPYLGRPVGRPPLEGYEGIIELGPYQALSWRHPQRLVLVIVDKPDPKTGQLELFPRYFFLITNYSEKEKDSAELLEHYRARGTFEDRIGELQESITPHLSSPKFAENEANFLLYLLGFNLMSMLRGELERGSPNGWDLRRMQTTVLKVGALVTKGARRLFVRIAQAAVFLWERLLKRISKWVLPSQCSDIRGPGRRPWIPLPPHAHQNLVLRE